MEGLIRSPWREHEIGRAVFHVIAANAAMAYYYFTGTLGAYLLLVTGAIISLCDYSRTRGLAPARLIPQFVLKMVRDHEKTRISAITHFIIAATLIDFLHLFCGLEKSTILPAVMFVSIGDPMARLAGKTMGRTPLMNTGKTLAGSVSFFITGTAAALFVCRIAGCGVSPAHVVIAGICATMIELFSQGWDNFHIPFWTTLLLWSMELWTMA